MSLADYAEAITKRVAAKCGGRMFSAIKHLYLEPHIRYTTPITWQIVEAVEPVEVINR